MNKWYFAAGTALLLCSLSTGALAQQSTESGGTKIIIIEEKTDRWGNKTVNKTVREGHFTDEEIEKIIAEETQNSSQHKDKHSFADKAKNDRGYLGVMIGNSDEGVEVTEVVKGSPAEKAGLQSGDIITAVGGTTVTDYETLVEVVSSHKPGESVEVTYSRGGTVSSVPVELGVREEIYSDVFELEDEMNIEDDEEREFGVSEDKFKEHKSYKEAHKLHEKMEKEHAERNRPRFGVSIDEVGEGQGVLVTQVYEGSLAEQAGVHEGDIITHFNGVEVNSAEQLIEAVKAAPANENVVVVFLREGKKMKEKVTFERT